MISFTTVLARWVDESRSSVFLITCTDCVGFVRNFIVGFWVCLTTIIYFVFAGTIHVVLVFACLPFVLTALVSIVTWLFQWWFFWVLLCVLLRHSVYLQFIWGFRIIQFKLTFKMWHNLFICAILQMRLVDWFYRWGGFLAYMNCSMITWAATPNASIASFWSSSGKSINFWFAGLKTSRWNLLLPLTEHARMFYGTQSKFLPNSFCWRWWCF